MALIKFEGKAIGKLISVISEGIGKVYEPKGIRKKAEAEAYALETIEKAKSKALTDGKEAEAECLLRIQERFIYQELKRQNNIDRINQIAIAQINEDVTPSEEPVNKDWITRFYNLAEDISDEDMQDLWGRILAGEVNSPKSFSLRTLDILKNLSKEEAEIFSKLANFSIINGGIAIVHKGRLNEIHNDFPFSQVLLLGETGLLQTENTVQLSLDYINNDNSTEINEIFVSGDISIHVNVKPNINRIQIPVYAFTNPGFEILKLIAITPNLNYLKEFSNSIFRNGVTIEYYNKSNKIDSL